MPAAVDTISHRESPEGSQHRKESTIGQREILAFDSQKAFARPGFLLALLTKRPGEQIPRQS